MVAYSLPRNYIYEKLWSYVLQTLRSLVDIPIFNTEYSEKKAKMKALYHVYTSVLSPTKKRPLAHAIRQTRHLTLFLPLMKD